MSQNPIDDQINAEMARNDQRLTEKLSALWILLDNAELDRNTKNEISNIVEGVVYYAQRQGLQQAVKVTNDRLSGLYWACRPSTYTAYYQHSRNLDKATNA